MVLNTKELNKNLKKTKPQKWEEGWRVKTGQKAWVPTQKIINKYAPKKTPCKVCGGTEFTLHGLGVNVTPMWSCKNCEVLYDAKKK